MVSVLDHDDSAYIALIKRDFSAEARRSAASSGAAMPGGRYPIEDKSDLENAIRAVGRGKGSHAAIRAHIMRRARALGATDAIPEDWKGGANKALTIFKRLRELFVKDGGDARDFDEVIDESEAREDAAGMLAEIDEAVSALRTAIFENLGDDDVTDKAAACQECFDQFKEHIAGVVPEEMEKALAAGIAAAIAGEPGNQGDDMDKAKLRKALGLAETASDADVEKAIADATEGATFAANVEKMSASHSAYMGNENAKMPAGGKKKFAAMSPSERDAHVKANPVGGSDDDESAEKKLEKALKALPPEIAAIVKDGQEARSAVEKLRDKSELSDIEKRIEPLTHIGKASDLAVLLHKVRKADAPTADAFEAIFKSLNEIIAKGEVFKEHGSGKGAAMGSAAATETINKMAEELKKSDPKLSIEKARTMVRDRNPELRKQEEDQRKERQRAAA